MIDSRYAISAIVVMGLVTFALRALPFVAAQWLKKHPLVQRLGDFLPLTIMTLLMVHSVAGAAVENPTGPWSALGAATLVLLLQWRSKNALLSILVGTGVYVLLRNANLA